jgi:cell division protein ZapA
MGQVTLKLNGYSHTIACKDGEEEHLRAMGEVVEQRLGIVRQVAGQGNESRMLVMAALLMADDIYELEKKASRGGGASAPAPDPKLGRRLGKLARRAEDIATSLEQP